MSADVIEIVDELCLRLSHVYSGDDEGDPRDDSQVMCLEARVEEAVLENHTECSEELIADYEIPGVVRVEIGWLGEGLNGDFDLSDPEDLRVLRFTATDLRQRIPRGAGDELRDLSHCTLIPALVPAMVLRSVCRHMAEALAESTSWKRLAESFSWLGEDDAWSLHTWFESETRLGKRRGSLAGDFGSGTPDSGS